MSLQETLARFQKQQEKCQTTLTSIATARQASAKTSAPHRTTPNLQKATPPNASSSANARPPAPAVKFSNDTERLQIINSIRRAPVGAQIKRVIDLLLEVGLLCMIIILSRWQWVLCPFWYFMSALRGSKTYIHWSFIASLVQWVSLDFGVLNGLIIVMIFRFLTLCAYLKKIMFCHWEKSWNNVSWNSLIDAD